MNDSLDFRGYLGAGLSGFAAGCITVVTDSWLAGIAAAVLMMALLSINDQLALANELRKASAENDKRWKSSLDLWDRHLKRSAMPPVPE